MEMNWLEQAAQLTVVLGFCGMVFNYIVIRPLNESLKRLSTILADIRSDLNKDRERLNHLEGAIAKIEQAVVTAHKRIDNFLHKEASRDETS